MKKIEIDKDLKESLESWRKVYDHFEQDAESKKMLLGIRMDESFRVIYSFEKIVRMIDGFIANSEGGCGNRAEKFLAHWNKLSDIGLNARERQQIGMTVSEYRRMMYAKYMGFIDSFYKYGEDGKLIPCDTICYELEN